ncbi:MAG: hypothetical protein ACRCTZ_07340 [Sarcina sp.]
MSNKELDNIRVEKDIAISMTKELGLKVAKVIKSNFDMKKDMNNTDINNKIIEDIKSIEIKEAFKLEEKR